MTSETVKLTLEVPKGVVDFLTDLSALGGSENSLSKFQVPGRVLDFVAAAR